ncbi:ABC transporter permease [Streptomyces roseolus]|uniref:ABC transporter permease n=1 Tax=Streptomyces roseolus TaxID=67358 RepID=UPI0037B3E884
MARAVALATAVVSLLLAAFARPSVRSSVREVPIAAAGPAPAVEQFAAVLGQRLPDGFGITEVADTAAAERLIRDREVYGAIDLGSGTPRVITASGASVAVAQTLDGVAAGLGQAPGASAGPAVRDHVPLPAGDPRGAGLAAGALPLVMGGLLTALVLTRLVRCGARHVAGAVAFVVTGGLATVAVLRFWLGSLDGSAWTDGGAIALTLVATSLRVLGLESLLGPVGFGLGAAVMMLVGNPLSGTAIAPGMPPGWSGALGHLLPPGAGGRLPRSTAFFDGHGASRPAAVLAGRLTLGVAVALVGGLRARARARPVDEGTAAVAVAVDGPAVPAAA